MIRGAAGDLFGAEVKIVERAGGGQGVGAAGAHRGDPVLGLQHVARAGDGVDSRPVRADQHGFELAQIPVGAPVLGQLDTGASELAGVLLQLLLQPLQQSEGVGRGAGEARHHLAVHQPADLAGIALDHGLAHRDLAVAGDHR